MAVTEQPLAIEVEELAERRAGPDAPVILDVREPHELAICRFPESLDIPMGSLPQRIDELPTDRPIVVVCRSGARSMRITQWLRAHGRDDVSNLTGGVLAWSARIDPSWPTY
ncbi:MAG TPA: rhodanese-like domain-containing protein [Geminicoccus sp.]|jgi:adenylyltransferase/sulfurtransferase|uniref:rhodanese-like domain-containing protein n=1 Tax=Geminicoccus sp. TaxID=2024832 RepID=UPI002E31B5C5|nr:rhodanese-like domain-containing protein [Geminicoccus sp.]HEX2525103.1 rhodanese-like domain-containing protein [Geminicoccus sp.]